MIVSKIFDWATAFENQHNRTVSRNNRSTRIKNITLTPSRTYRVQVRSDRKTYTKTVKTIEERYN